MVGAEHNFQSANELVNLKQMRMKLLYLKRGPIKKKINAGFLVVPEGEARF